MSDHQIPNNPMEGEVPTLDNPGLEATPQPVQFTQVEYDSTPQQANQPQYNQAQLNQPQVEPPKKSKKKLVALIATIVGLVACTCVAVFAGPNIIAALSKNTKKAPIDRFKNAITNISDQFKDELESTSASSHEFNSENIKANINFDLTLGEYVMAMLPAEYSSINNLGGSMNVVSFDKNQYVDLTLSSQSNKLASIEVYLDSLANMGYLKVPELSPNFLSVAIDNEMISMYSNTTLNGLQIDPKVLVALIEDETDLLLSSIDTVDLEENSVVEANGVTAKYDKLSSTIEGQKLVDIAYDLSKRFLEDETMIALLSQADTFSGKDIASLLEEIKNWEVDEDLKIIVDLYLDKKDNIVGFVLTPQKADESVKVGYLTSEKDGKTGFEFFMIVEDETILELEGSYTEKSNAYNGNATLTVYEDGISSTSIDVSFEDVSSDDGKLKGSFSVSSPQLMGAIIQVDMDYKDERIQLGLGVSMAGTSLFSLSFDATASEANSCPTVPADAVIYDAETEAEDYMSSADLMSFLQNIQDVTGLDIMSLFYSTVYGY